MVRTLYCMPTEPENIAEGGRQVDGAIASLDALAMIMKSSKIRDAQEKGSFTIFFDSGIRSGAHIVGLPFTTLVQRIYGSA